MVTFFKEKKFDLSSVSSYLASKDLNSQPEDEKFKMRMLSFSDFYFDASDLSEGQKMLNGLTYRSDITNSIENRWHTEVDLIEKLRTLKIPIFSLTSATDRITVREYYQNRSSLDGVLGAEIESGGHFACFTRHEEVARYIQKFIGLIKVEISKEVTA